MPRTARINAIKSFRCYTLREAAEVTGVTTRTIHTWIKEGMQVMAEQRPYLVRGDELRSFIKRRRRERKIETKLNEFFCFSCQDARLAAGGFAECISEGNRVSVKALCEVCGTLMNKPVSKARLPELAGMLELLHSPESSASKAKPANSNAAPNLALKRQHQNRH